MHVCDYHGKPTDRHCNCGMPAPSNRAVIVHLDDVVLEYYDGNLRLIKAPKGSMFVKAELGYKWIEVARCDEDEAGNYPELRCYFIDDVLYMEV